MSLILNLDNLAKFSLGKNESSIEIVRNFIGSRYWLLQWAVESGSLG
jgi:hypothetical protein